MNVFEYAKKMELNGINFYLDELDRATCPGFKKILQTLIDEEEKHYVFFDILQQKLEPGKLLTFPLDEVKNVFQQMRKNKEGFDFSVEQIEAYRKALEIEKRSENFYRNEAAKIENKDIKLLFLTVAAEEQKHVILMDGVVEYINRPNEWVEHAMFSQLRQEY